MKRLVFSQLIQLPPSEVYRLMIDDEMYRKWTYIFCPGSFYQGSWITGETIDFLMIDEHGKPQGLHSLIERAVEGQEIVIKHLGAISDGNIDLHSDEVKKWSPAYEIYRFEAVDSGTLVTTEIDCTEDHIKYFEEKWPDALALLAQLCEKTWQTERDLTAK
ncbi:MAG TPA: SRPBCC domain-containing protein [Luteibaculaceae bacterium]|jgi:hypothetical protein|nr:SRPBCC domain-containing protein [Luteibaculaceae bacterium]